MAKKTTSTGGKGKLAKKRAMAFDLYFGTDQTLKEISDIVQVNYDTLCKWAKADKWKEQKAANSITREKIIQNQLVHISNLQDEINSRDKKYPTPAEQDSILKATKIIRDLSNRTSLPDYFNVLNEFLKSLALNDPTKAKAITAEVRGFLQTKTSELDA